MRRKDVRLLLLAVAWCLLLVAAWTHGSVSSWVRNIAFAAVGGLLSLEWGQRIG